jgi:trimethyllysine dioxygenase
VRRTNSSDGSATPPMLVAPAASSTPPSKHIAPAVSACPCRSASIPRSSSCSASDSTTSCCSRAPNRSHVRGPSWSASRLNTRAHMFLTRASACSRSASHSSAPSSNSTLFLARHSSTHASATALGAQSSSSLAKARSARASKALSAGADCTMCATRPASGCVVRARLPSDCSALAAEERFMRRAELCPDRPPPPPASSHASASPQMPPSTTVVQSFLKINHPALPSVSLPLLWLWDHSPNHLHPGSLQRTLDSSALPSLQVAPRAHGFEQDDLVIDWQDGVRSVYPVSFLRAHAHAYAKTTHAVARYGLPRPELWASGQAGPGLAPPLQLPAYSAEDATECTRHVLAALARTGVCILSGMPMTLQGTERVLRQVVGPPRETFYGGMWDTAPKLGNVNDTAYTNLALDPHTDCTYLADTPGLQCFNCVAQSDAGAPSAGATRLVDGFALAAHMRRDNPAAFAFFSSTPLVFKHVESKVNVRATRKVIELDPYDSDGPDAHPVQFRYNGYDLAPLTYLADAQLEAFYRHNHYLGRLARDPRFTVLRKLRVGECLIVDNHRVMHGRTAFTGYRNLVGCYVGVDDWTSRARDQLAL